MDRVVARRIDGGQVSGQSLLAALATPTPVILVKAGEQIDPPPFISPVMP